MVVVGLMGLVEQVLDGLPPDAMRMQRSVLPLGIGGDADGDFASGLVTLDYPAEFRILTAVIRDLDG
jgi:hypothetical protein